MDMDDLRRRRKAAVEMLDAGRVEDALVELKKLKSEAPEDMLVLSYLGLALAREGADTGRAIEACSKAAQIEFFRPECFLNLAKVYLQLGKKPQAIEAIYKGLTVDPEHDELRQLAYSLGIRRKPALGFLPRNHPLNKWIGRLTWWLSGESHASAG